MGVVVMHSIVFGHVLLSFMIGVKRFLDDGSGPDYKVSGHKVHKSKMRQTII